LWFAEHPSDNTVIGHDIVKQNFSIDSPIAGGIMEHHERLDLKKKNTGESLWEFYNLVTGDITYHAAPLNHRVDKERLFRAAMIDAGPKTT